ncbi:MAG: type II toxin-antitoxin system Phd/YefM family antitoxin [Chloroflexota bacterium]|nr:type II toxin-antitoxin system Phd/YefM family antitoxin [Chloroflexota bacterium]
MERVVSAAEAHLRFGELMRQVVETQTPVVVVRDGQPLVVVLPVEEYERLQSGQPERRPWEELLEQAHSQIRAERGDRKLPPSEEIIREMREGRDAQIDEQLTGLR